MTKAEAGEICGMLARTFRAPFDADRIETWFQVFREAPNQTFLLQATRLLCAESERCPVPAQIVRKAQELYERQRGQEWKQAPTTDAKAEAIRIMRRLAQLDRDQPLYRLQDPELAASWDRSRAYWLDPKREEEAADSELRARERETEEPGFRRARLHPVRSVDTDKGFPADPAEGPEADARRRLLDRQAQGLREAEERTEPAAGPGMPRGAPGWPLESTISPMSDPEPGDDEFPPEPGGEGGTHGTPNHDGGDRAG